MQAMLQTRSQVYLHQAYLSSAHVTCARNQSIKLIVSRHGNRWKLGRHHANNSRLQAQVRGTKVCQDDSVSNNTKATQPRLGTSKQATKYKPNHSTELRLITCELTQDDPKSLVTMQQLVNWVKQVHGSKTSGAKLPQGKTYRTPK